MTRLGLVSCVGVFVTAAAWALSLEEAAQYIGKEGAVNGLAVEVAEASGHVFVNLGAKYPDQLFTAFVAREDVPAVGLDYLRSLEGRLVSVAGRIVKAKGKPRIQVKKRDQIIAVMEPAE